MSLSAIHEREPRRVLALPETPSHSTFRQLAWWRRRDRELNYSPTPVLACVAQPPGRPTGAAAGAFGVSLSGAPAHAAACRPDVAGERGADRRAGPRPIPARTVR